MDKNKFNMPSSRIDENKLIYFKEYMKNESPETQNFDSKISKSPTNTIALQTSRQLRKSQERITNIDSEAIPSDKKLDKINSKSCGASFSQKQAINKNRRKRKYRTSNRKAIRKIMAIGLVSSALFFGGKIKDINEYNHLSASKNQENDYETLVSTETRNKLQTIETTINSAKSSGIEPSQDILEAINVSLDTVIDEVMSDLVTQAFNEKYPNYKVTCVETRYDKTTKFSPHEFCEISYINDQGSNSKTVSNFNSDILQSFDYEYSLDKGELTLEELETIYKDIDHLAGTKFVYKDNIFTFFEPYLKTTTPKKENHDLEL